MAEEPGAYERGVEAGRVEQTLAEHATHLNKINGSMEKVFGELHQLVVAVQRLADRMDADAATAVATASALAKDEVARRGRAERRWSPWARLATVIGALAAVAGVIVAVWLALD